MSYGPLNEPLVIYLQYPTARCCICGEWDVSQWGVPVDDIGLIVANDYEGEWGGVPACKKCWQEHELGMHVGTYPRY
jgi:hypothetical protein